MASAGSSSVCETALDDMARDAAHVGTCNNKILVKHNCFKKNVSSAIKVVKTKLITQICPRVEAALSEEMQQVFRNLVKEPVRDILTADHGPTTDGTKNVPTTFNERSSSNWSAVAHRLQSWIKVWIPGLDSKPIMQTLIGRFASSSVSDPSLGAFVKQHAVKAFTDSCWIELKVTIEILSLQNSSSSASPFSSSAETQISGGRSVSTAIAKNQNNRDSSVKSIENRKKDCSSSSLSKAKSSVKAWSPNHPDRASALGMETLIWAKAPRSM